MRTPKRTVADCVDIASIAVFRILFGIAITVDACLMSREEIVFNWIEPSFLFKYFGFGSVHPLPADGMVAVWWTLRVLGLCVALGFCYRAAMTLFFLGFTYTFLISQSEYLNHAYLICLLSFLMIFIPAHGALSVDARLRPGVRRDTLPRWNLLLLQFQIGVVYLFAGLAKLTPDWFAGHSLRFWFATTRDLPLIGPLFAADPVPVVAAWVGVLFDLLIVPLMLIRRTRPFAFAVAILFHVTNACLFDIGVFPWLMLAATTLYFDPDWPRRSSRSQPSVTCPPPSVFSSLVLALYVAVQLVLPLRHFAYPGDVNWTEEGDLFSWRMKLRDKQGWSRFFVTHPPSRRTWMADPALHLNPVQATRMSGQPDMVLQYAYFLAGEAKRHGYDRVEVRARVVTSLNARKPQLLVDPRVDLAAQPRTLAPVSWIQPLEGPATKATRATVADVTEEEAMDLFTRRRRAERDLAVLTRLAHETMNTLRTVDVELRSLLGVDPAGDYSFDSASGKLFRLRPDGAGGIEEQEVRTLENKADVQRFAQLADGKKRLLARAEVLRRAEARALEEEADLFTRLQNYLQSPESADIFRAHATGQD